MRGDAQNEGSENEGQLFAYIVYAESEAHGGKVLRGMN